MLGPGLRRGARILVPYPRARAAWGAAVAAIPWRETWTMAGCGKVYDVSMQFFPRVVGTTIVAYKARPHH